LVKIVDFPFFAAVLLVVKRKLLLERLYLLSELLYLFLLVALPVVIGPDLACLSEFPPLFALFRSQSHLLKYP